jgi:alkanesulfonate monooxygenase SsuD/methylene tetrahydromethanopterin reductase-like flavin-dependent oxidoreductase (luciferase family)
MTSAEHRSFEPRPLYTPSGYANAQMVRQEWSMTTRSAPSFGIKTTPAQVGYDDLRRVWLDADEIPEIEHAWLYDHLLPLLGDPSGPAYEGWTMLAALGAQTQRLRLGLLVTNNRVRLPAVLAKIAATVDVISGGRLDFGIGVGGLPRRALANSQFNVDTEDAVASFAEACTLIRRLWTEDVVDFAGAWHQVRGGRCNPKPLQRPHPPILIGGLGRATLQIVAEFADIWNAIGPPVTSVEDLVARGQDLDECCTAIGRDPATIVRSAQLPISYDDPISTRTTLRALADAGFSHLVINPPSPYPHHLARWVADELIILTLEDLALHPRHSA